MGKLEEIAGNLESVFNGYSIKEYEYGSMSARRLDKGNYELCDELSETIDRDLAAQKMKDVLAHQGQVIILKKKRQIHGIVIVKLAHYTTADFTVDTEAVETKEDSCNQSVRKAFKAVMDLDNRTIIGSARSKEKYWEKLQDVAAYEVTGCYLTRGLQEKDHQLRDDCFTFLKEKALCNDLHVKAVIWGEHAEVDLTIGRSQSSAVGIGMMIGVCLGVVLGSVFSLISGNALNLCVGVAIGCSLGVALGSSYGYSSEYVTAGRKQDINI